MKPSSSKVSKGLIRHRMAKKPAQNVCHHQITRETHARTIDTKSHPFKMAIINPREQQLLIKMKFKACVLLVGWNLPGSCREIWSFSCCGKQCIIYKKKKK